MKTPTLPTIFAAMIAGFSQLGGEIPDSHEAEVKRLAQPLIDAQLMPGLAIGIYDNGHVETYGLGIISKEHPTPPDANTLFEIGSVTKVFTSLLLAEAITRGEVALDTPLSRLLPPDVKPPKRDGEEITLEDLATHWSGLPRIPTNMVDSLANPYAGYGRDKLLADLNDCQVSRKPGAEWQYSNLGMGLLGTLLADKAGMSYEKLLQQGITNPLSMADTTVSLSPGQQLRLAPPHRSGVRVPNWDFDALAGCGAIRSTVADLLKLIAAEIDPASTPLAAPIEFAAKRRRAIPGQATSMALGWWLAGDGTTLSHNGQTGGYSASVFVNPPLKKGIVVLSNGAASIVDSLGEKLFQSLAGMKVDPLKIRPAVRLPDAQLERLVGIYPSDAGFTITITRSEDFLFAQLTDQGALRIFAESPTRFFYRDVVAALQFEMDPTNDFPTAVTLLQNGKQFRCPREP